MACQSESQHFNSVFRARQKTILFVRWGRRRHEEYAVKVGLFKTALRYDQVSEMDRIKAPSEDCQFFCHDCRFLRVFRYYLW
jgi:hypothetical protein